jgi:DNA-binding CsgD family transcriptional regulator
VARGETVDADRVRAAATGLRRAGLGWEGARLAATAAPRTADRKAGAGLMAFARGLHDSSGSTPDPVTPPPTDEPVDTQPATEPAASEESASALSERELEVGRLILAGLTHKQIGARLFISAKTVEHHVARMRHRLGADGRTELFGMLRHLLGESGDTVTSAPTSPSQARA